jgi:hypothetical protein
MQYGQFMGAAAHTLWDGGVTCHEDGRIAAFFTGYGVGGAVAGSPVVMFRPKSVTRMAEHLADFAHQYREKLGDEYPMRYIGTWCHEGRVYLDVSDILFDRDEALGLARERGEKAIFEYATGRTIYVED